MTATITASVADLARVVTGPVLTAENPSYAEEVAGFNVAHRPRPAVVVGAVSAGDVAAAISWAAAAGLPVSVQATGHGLVADVTGGLLISTRRLQQIRIDPAAGTATVGAGVRWRAVIDAAAPHGLAPLNGSSSSVGAVGYTLGGGMGLLARRYGFAADHVRSLTVVTADGVARVVDEHREPDLFWAMRGGKAGFGIVTEMTIDLMPVSRFFGGGLFFAGADAARVLHAWRTWAPQLPDEVTTSVALLRLPPDPQLPPPLQGQFVTHLRYTHLGDAATAAELLEPMRAVAPVIFDTVGEMPYPACDAVHMDPPVPMPAFDHGLALAALPAEAVDAIVAAAGAESGSAVTLTEVRLLGGRLAAPPAVPNAVAGRNAPFGVYVLGVPAGPAAELIPAQVDAVVAALRPWRSGSLPNFLGHGGPAEYREQWSPSVRGRLADIAARFDPRGTFGGRELFG